MKKLCTDIKSDIDRAGKLIAELNFAEYKNSTMICHSTVFYFND